MFSTELHYEVVTFSVGDTKAGTKMGKLQLKDVENEEILNCILWEEALNRMDSKLFRNGNILRIVSGSFNEKFNNCLVTSLELIKEAKTYCEDVEFSALDATRADEDFIIAAAKEAEANGAGMVTICDDAGNSTPDEIAALVAKVKEAVKVPVYVRVSDRINMAVASAFADIGLCKVIDKSSLSSGSNFTIGNRFTI